MNGVIIPAKGQEFKNTLFDGVRIEIHDDCIMRGCQLINGSGINIQGDGKLLFENCTLSGGGGEDQWSPTPVDA